MQENDATARCENCERQFPAEKIDLHEAYCRRNIRKCKLCNEMVDINQKQKHDNEFHSMKKCKYCAIEFEQVHIQQHQTICEKRPVLCKFCENEHASIEIRRHEEVCGSRTQECTVCSKPIRIRDLAKHQEQCSRKREELRRNQSQRQLPPNPSHERFNVHPPRNPHENRNRMRSNENAARKLTPERREMPNHVKVKPSNVIGPQNIKAPIDPIPISIRLAMQKERKNRLPLKGKAFNP